jgi:signal transduction histidine kinase/CheY-like chemotaxis protein
MPLVTNLSAPLRRVVLPIALAAAFCTVSLFVWHSVVVEVRYREISSLKATTLISVAAIEQQLNDVMSRMNRIADSFSAVEIATRDHAQLTAKLIRAVGLLPEVSATTILDAEGSEIASSRIAVDERTTRSDFRSRTFPALLASSPEHLTLHSVTIGNPGNIPWIVGVRRIEGARAQLAGLLLLTIRPDALAAILTPAWLPNNLRTSLVFPESLATGEPAPAAPASSFERALANLRDWFDPLSTPRELSSRVGAVSSERGSRYGVGAEVIPDILSADEAAASRGRLIWLIVALGGLGFVAVLASFTRSGADASSAAQIARLEEELTSTRVDRNRVLASVSHDIRTALVSIGGLTLMLQDSELMSQQRNWVDLVQASTQSLLDMVSGLLEVSSGEKGRKALLTDDVDVAALVQSVATVAESRANEKGLQLRSHIDSAVQGIWQTDSTRLRQILSNLVDNAIKYTSNGEIDINVSVVPKSAELHQIPDAAQTILLAVSDSGPGIAPADRERIFDLYERGSLHGGSKEGGLGLGLAICRENAAVMGGAIVFDSVIGEGTEFKFSFPAIRLRAAVPREERNVRHALVVGFDDARRRKLSQQLEELGFLGQTAADGYVGLGVAERILASVGAIDLVVVDGNMLPLTAAAFLQRLRAWQAIEKARVLWVGTAGDGEAVAAKAHADAFVPPPGLPQDVQAEITSVMKGALDHAPVSASDIEQPGGRLLIVEDNKPHQCMLLQFFTQQGFAVFTADNGEDAVNAARRGQFDAILMDLQLPGIEGGEAARRIRALGGKTAQIPILAQTALTGPSTRRKCAEAGITDIIEKTPDLHRVADRVRMLIQRSQAASRGAVGDGNAQEARDVTMDESQGAIETFVRTFGLEKSRDIVEGFLAQGATQCQRLIDLAVTWDVGATEQVCHDLAGVARSLGDAGLLNTIQSFTSAAQQGERDLGKFYAAQAQKDVNELRTQLLHKFATMDQNQEPGRSSRL